MPKKIVCPDSREEQTIEEKVRIVWELREKYSLGILLKLANLSKLTYHDNVKNYVKRKHKDDEWISEIREIFNHNYQKYGNIRVTIELKKPWLSHQ